ncbi:neuromedin-S isoform X4 [Crocuta crocuta]
MAWISCSLSGWHIGQLFLGNLRIIKTYAKGFYFTTPELRSQHIQLKAGLGAHTWSEKGSTWGRFFGTMHSTLERTLGVKADKSLIYPQRIFFPPVHPLMRLAAQLANRRMKRFPQQRDSGTDFAKKDHTATLGRPFFLFRPRNGRNTEANTR